MQSSLAVTAVLMGLVGGPHCVAMCGAACAGLAQAAGPRQRLALIAFQIGRLVGYSVLGAVAAGGMQALGWLTRQSAALRPVWSMLHVAAMLLGLLLMLQARQPVWLDQSARRLWQRIRHFHDRRTRSAPWIIGALWAVSVLVEIAWFFLQGRLMRLASMTRWLLVCSWVAVVRMALIAGAADWIVVLIAAQCLHAFTFADHHTACIAVVSHHFPGRLRARGQALFTVIGYGLGGLLGVLVGGALITRLGYEGLYAAATVLALLAAGCAWRMQALERSAGLAVD